MHVNFGDPLSGELSVTGPDGQTIGTGEVTDFGKGWPHS